MTREELIKKVALKMDEISSSDDIIVAVSSSDNNPLYTQINNLLNESINDVLTKAPIYRIPDAFTATEADLEGSMAILGNTRRAGVISLPEDFIRLVSISASDLERHIVDLSIEGDETDKRQHNKFLVAKNAKPVGVLGRAEGNRVIYVYSFEKDITPLMSLTYVKRFTDTVNDIELDDYMSELVSWVCAGRVFAVQGDINRGKICDDNAAALMI
jgi:hypothetical protein